MAINPKLQQALIAAKSATKQLAKPKAGGGEVDRDANLANFMEGSHHATLNGDGSPKVFYTGTSKDKDFSSFNVGRHGVWLTSDPEIASQYATQNDSMGYQRDGSRLTPTNTASRVMPVHIHVKNPFTGHLPDEIKHISNYKKAQSDWFDTLRAKGHDAWIPQGGNVVAVLGHPGQIKSAIGNNGNFNPTKKSMTESQGGYIEKAGGGSMSGKAKGSKNLSYIGNCTDDDVIEHIFGDATNFAQAVEEHGDEFTIDDLVVKYDPESDIHSFYDRTAKAGGGEIGSKDNQAHIKDYIKGAQYEQRRLQSFTDDELPEIKSVDDVDYADPLVKKSAMSSLQPHLVNKHSDFLKEAVQRHGLDLTPADREGHYWHAEDPQKGTYASIRFMKDHPQQKGGGFNSHSGERSGDSDIDVHYDEDGKFHVISSHFNPLHQLADELKNNFHGKSALDSFHLSNDRTAKAGGGEVDNESPAPIKLSGPNPKVKNWVDKMYGSHPEWPLGGNKSFVIPHETNDQGQIQKWTQVSMTPHGKRAHISWVSAYPQKEGVGRVGMQKLMDSAAEHGVGLTLSPWDKGQVPASKLHKFYKSLGFEGPRGGSLTWDPPAKEIDESNDDRTAKAGGGSLFGDPDNPVGAQIGQDPHQKMLSKLKGPQIVKDPGGNFLSGSVESAVRPLGRNSFIEHLPGAFSLPQSPEDAINFFNKKIQDDPESSDLYQRQLPKAKQTKSVNDFVTKQLTRYIKNEMGTEKDPIRELAERGISHAPYDIPNSDVGYVNNLRKLAKTIYPNTQSMAKSDLAKKWENLTDRMLIPTNREDALIEAGNYEDALIKAGMGGNSWLSKVDPKTPIYGQYNSNFRYGLLNLKFDHLVDELQNSVNPESDLPDHLKFRHESLARMSVPQAVQHVHNINEWRRKNREEANKEKAFNSATFLHKDYPDSNYAWHELRLPESDKDGKEKLDEALNYEGSVMGHCVGGYTNSVAFGKKRIFSLRNKKTGEPHVTIETRPKYLYYSDLLNHLGGDEDLANDYLAQGVQARQNATNDNNLSPLSHALNLAGVPRENIEQIKGKGNERPADRYLPYVHDFVKSGRWGSVKDLQNTNLQAIHPESDLAQKLKNMGEPVPQYVDDNELSTLTKKTNTGIYSNSGIDSFATGGAVKTKKPIDPEKEALKAANLAKAKIENKKAASESFIKPEETENEKRILFRAEGSGGVKGIIVPRHMWEGYNLASGERAPGLREINAARAKVYGSENRDPLTLNSIAKIHQRTLQNHFAKPLSQQIADEKTSLDRLRAARHIAPNANTLDESEKTDTVKYEDKPHSPWTSKGVAGHALYSSGVGENQKIQVLNTCPGQTTGCSGGVSKDGIVDTMLGTCFAPNAESQYGGAAVRRACHEQAKHDPAMTTDWILAHTGSLRQASQMADKDGLPTLFRPNVVDETDVSSRYVIDHLNDQRQLENKEREKMGLPPLPPIIANSYGKGSELHDPENGYYITHSNIGPKTKLGASIRDNSGLDNKRIRETITAVTSGGKDYVNRQGNKTPPKGSYLVNDVKRYSPLDKAIRGSITHAKYWSAPRTNLTPQEKEEGPEGHYDGEGNPTTPELAHYGHTTIDGSRYDYQKQHILHPRMVAVPYEEKIIDDAGKPTGQTRIAHKMIPTDSRFRDEDVLAQQLQQTGQKRFKSKNGKYPGVILMTTPTESTSNAGHQTEFTHHVDQDSVTHALANNGEYEIDNPQAQIASANKPYAAPKELKFAPKKFAFGGMVGDVGDDMDDYMDDDHHLGLPEQNYKSQQHIMHRERPENISHSHHQLHKNVANIDQAMQLVAKLRRHNPPGRR